MEVVCGCPRGSVRRASGFVHTAYPSLGDMAIAAISPSGWKATVSPFGSNGIKSAVGSWEDNLLSSKEAHYRGDNSYETHMARPFRILHRGGRGQDFDRSVSVQ